MGEGRRWNSGFGYLVVVWRNILNMLSHLCAVCVLCVLEGLGMRLWIVVVVVQGLGMVKRGKGSACCPRDLSAKTES